MDVKDYSNLQRVMQRFRRNRLAVIGALIILLIVLMAIFAPLLAPYDPTEQDYEALLLPPSWEHPFGTDDLGRDILSRIIYGSRYTLLVGIGVVLIVAVVGSLLGFIAGYYRGKLDTLIMRLVDVMLSVPVLVLALAISGALGGGLINVIIAIGAVGWTQFARLVRGEVLHIRGTEYIKAAKALGANDFQIIFFHLAPNMVAPVIVYTTLYIPSAILWAASLSFLGLGVQPPIPEWGALIADGRSYLSYAWWIATMPGLAIMLTVLGFNFMGDGLRDALDPKMAKDI
ncbi:MAG: ABC transporter permease [Halanaerobiales bacterium]|nr:ABC transporter permease [Halanaerobiales bacterium]